MSTSRYTVRRVGWFQPPHGDPYTRRLPGAEAVAGFDTFDDAEEFRAPPFDAVAFRLADLWPMPPALP